MAASSPMELRPLSPIRRGGVAQMTRPVVFERLEQDFNSFRERLGALEMKHSKMETFIMSAIEELTAVSSRLAASVSAVAASAEAAIAKTTPVAGASVDDPAVVAAVAALSDAEAALSAIGAKLAAFVAPGAAAAA